MFHETKEKFGLVRICVPAAGITRDALAVRVDKETGKASVYDIDHFRLVVEVNLIAPVYWALQMVAQIAKNRAALKCGRWKTEERVQGTFIVIGSISSRGNKGQISYSATKAGLKGAAATLMSEAIFHGVRGCRLASRRLGPCEACQSRSVSRRLASSGWHSGRQQAKLNKIRGYVCSAPV